MSHPLPTRRDEQWRYADLLALEPHWSDLARPAGADHRGRR